MRQISRNLLVMYSSSPLARALFSSMLVVALIFPDRSLRWLLLWFGSWWFPAVLTVIQWGCWLFMMSNLLYNVLFPGSDSMWLLEMISHRFLGLSCFSLYQNFGWTQLLLVARVLSVVAPVPCNNTICRVRQLWFWGSCMCSEGCYY